MINAPTNVKGSPRINKSTEISKKRMNLKISPIFSPQKHTHTNYSKLAQLLKDILLKLK